MEANIKGKPTCQYTTQLDLKLKLILYLVSYLWMNLQRKLDIFQEHFVSLTHFYSITN